MISINSKWSYKPREKTKKKILDELLNQPDGLRAIDIERKTKLAPATTLNCLHYMESINTVNFHKGRWYISHPAGMEWRETFLIEGEELVKSASEKSQRNLDQEGWMGMVCNDKKYSINTGMALTSSTADIHTTLPDMKVKQELKDHIETKVLPVASKILDIGDTDEGVIIIRIKKERPAKDTR